MSFRRSLSISTKVPVEIFPRITLTLPINLVRMCNLKILSLLTHEHSLSLCLYLSPLTFLLATFYNFWCVDLVHLLSDSNYFILFDTIVSSTFKISISSGSLQIYSNASDFYELILYPISLLKLFFSSRGFLVLYDFLCRLLPIKTAFFFYFQPGSLDFFFLHITLDRGFRTVWNR